MQYTVVVINSVKNQQYIRNTVYCASYARLTGLRYAGAQIYSECILNELMPGWWDILR